MILLLLGLVLFLGIHSVSIVAPRWRDAQAARSPGAWKGVYSVVAAIGLALVVVGYGVARQTPVVLWVPPVWSRHLALLLMVPAFVLLLATYLPGHISTATKHPMLLAVKIWAAAHLLANGTLADLVLFGGFLAWAVIDRISVKRRAGGASGPPARPAKPMNDAIAIAGGLAVWALFVFGLHRWLFRVAPLPAISA